MKLILHIGTEKTGTTSIQNFLHKNRSYLQKHGFYYFESLGGENHRLLPSYGMNHDRFDEFLLANQIDTKEKRIKFDDFVRSALEEEYRNIPSHIHTAIISSEQLHSRTVFQDEINKVRSLVSAFFKDIKILTYIRQQVDLAISLYSTALKAGNKDTLEGFVTSHCSPDNYYYNYSRYLDQWEAAYSSEDMEVGIFERSEFFNGDLIHDFCNRIGLELDFNDQELSKPENLNESLNPFGQFFLMTVNRIIPRFTQDNRWNEVSSRIHKPIIQYCVGTDSIDLELAKEIQSKFFEINRNVKEKWFKDKNNFFSFTESKYHKKEISFGESEKMAITALLQVIGKISLFNSDADALKDGALAIEKHDLGKARRLMELAHEVRPSGPFIAKKLLEYETILSSGNK